MSNYRVEIAEDGTKIEGFCKLNGWSGETSVIVLSHYLDKWHTASSMCLLSNIDSARIITKCYSEVFKTLSRMCEKNNEVKEIEKYLSKNNLKIGVIYSFDRNGNEYNYEFFLCDDEQADNMAWKLEIRKMENAGTFQATVDEAKDLGLTSLHDLYNYKS